MSGAALALHQFRFDQKTFWRNPGSVFFTVAFPVMFLVIFDLVFGGDERLEGLGVNVSTYYVPAILTLAVISATFQNLAMSVTIDREFGILKRGRGTPLPDWVFFAGRIGNSLVVSLVMLVLLAAIGRIAYGVSIPWDRAPAVLVTLAVGASAFCCLGLALTGFIPSQSAAAPITNIAIFPLYFLSGVFIPESEIPSGVLHVADVFPVRHFFEAFFAAWEPGTGGTGFEWVHLAIVAAWGIAGFLVGLRAFRWTPQAAG
ncbi:MAG TPA: ABC transporter permease [Solirubrobacterales bacterium]|jgi:ABC-2 type transport system permease protein|nr:ABC transporter permease [Solirubrobacterales bacterium]